MPKLRSSSCVCAATLLLARAAVASSIQDTVQPAYNLVPGSSDDPHNRIVHPFSEQALLHTRSKVVKGGSNTTDSLGRYGHAAAYIPSQNQILFIGGQVGVAGTYITNDVVVLDLSLPLANATQSSSANPARHPDFSVDLPPSAWGAATVDSYEQIWLVGGVTQNCEIDAPGYVFNSTNGIWRPVAVGNKRPPRRRQAHAVLLPGRGQQSVQDEIYIFGGIAEQYTCSLDTVAYLAIDDWQPQQANPALVNTTLWHAPTYGRSIPPAVSDYAVFKLPQCHDGVVYIGGQDASGKLLGMDTALLYNTTTKLWAQVHIGGETPLPRMGHSAVSLGDGRILVHGGVGARNQVVPASYILNPQDGNWTWTAVELADGSLNPPYRAWHSATTVKDNVVVIAFGMDAITGKTTDEIAFLSGHDSTGWTWSHKNPLYVPPAQTTTSTSPFSYSLWSPPATSTSSAAVGPIINAPSEPISYGAVAAPNQPSTTSDDQLTPTVSSIFSSSNLGSSDAQQQASSSRIVGGTVGGIFAAAAAAGLISWYLRRKRSSDALVLASSEDEKDAPPVTKLLYTRKVPQRVLSLGSDASVRTAAAFVAHGAYGSMDSANGSSSFRVIRPKSSIDEFGKIPGDVPAPQAVHIPSSGSDASEHSGRDSVASYPFLGSVPIRSNGHERISSISATGSVSELGRTLLRSQSMRSSESSSSNNSLLGNEARLSPGRLRVANGAASTPLPSGEFSRPTSLAVQDPFLDFDEMTVANNLASRAPAPPSQARGVRFG